VGASQLNKLNAEERELAEYVETPPRRHLAAWEQVATETRPTHNSFNMDFQYSPLDNDLDEIRLLTLHPGQDNSPVRCSLGNVSIGTHSRHVYNDGDFLYRWHDGRIFHTTELGDEITECSPLQYVPSYEALSYCWGDPSITESIEIDSNGFQVTANLYSALLHIRSKTEDKILWVDAVCMYQGRY
jgi:hypothetical protein